MSSVQTLPPPLQPVSVRTLTQHPALPYVLLGIAAALYLFPFMRTLTWSPDSGIYVYGADRVLHGAIPARDFIELQGPGSFYWLAVFFKLFGVSMFIARAVLLATGVAIALLIFHLSRQIGALGLFPAVFVLVTSIPFGVMNSPHYDSNLFALLSFAIFASGIRRVTISSRPDPRILAIFFAAGVLAGFTTCILQQKGAYLTCSYLLSLAILHRKRAWPSATSILAGYGCVVLTVGLLYAAAGALPSLLYWNFTWPMSHYATVNTSRYGFLLWEIWFPNRLAALRSVFPLPVAAAATFALGIPLLLVLCVPLLPALGWLWRSQTFRRAFQRDWIPYWLAAYALWISELHHLDFGHLRNGCLLLVLLFFALCEKRATRLAMNLSLVIAACAVLLGTANLLGALSYHTPVHTRRGTLLATKPDPALAFLLDHTNPGEDVFVYPYQPIYYFLAAVHNPTRFSNLMYQINADDQFREAVHDIDRKRVRYVLWDTVFSGENLRTLFPSYRVPPAGQQIMEPYLETHYHPIAFENGFRILERNQ